MIPSSSMISRSCLARVFWRRWQAAFVDDLDEFVHQGRGGREAKLQTLLAGYRPEAEANVRLSGAARSRFILPAIRSARWRSFAVAFTLAAVKRWLFPGASDIAVRCRSSSDSRTAHWRHCPPGWWRTARRRWSCRTCRVYRFPACAISVPNSMPVGD